MKPVFYLQRINMKNFNYYLNKVQSINESTKLRTVTVEYSNGQKIPTSMAAHLTDDDIRNYYKIGKEFNLGNGEYDNMQRVVGVEIDPIINKYVITDNKGKYITAKFNSEQNKNIPSWTDNIEFAYVYESTEDANNAITSLKEFLQNIPVVIMPFKRSLNESFGTDNFEKHAINFITKYGAKYIDNDASILEYLQNNDEDNSSEHNVIKLKEILNNSFKSYKDGDDDTVHLIPINGSRIEHFVEYVGDNDAIKKYVLSLNSKDWIKSKDGYLYYVTDVKNRLNAIKENIDNNIASQYQSTIEIKDDVDDVPLVLSLGLITNEHVYYHNPEGDELYCYDRNMNLLYTTGYQIDEIFMDDIKKYLWASPDMQYNIKSIEEEAKAPTFESKNADDFVNVLNDYTKWLSKIKQNSTFEAIINYNIMSMVVPAFDQWRTVNMSSTVGDTNYAIDYMDKTYCIQPGDVELVKANIGKQITFRYDATKPLRYMEDIKIKQ